MQERDHEQDFDYRDALPHGQPHRRGAGLNPGNRFEDNRVHVLGDERDRQQFERQWEGEDGKPVTRWDGETMKRSAVTGDMVPDASARLPVYDYDSAAQANWPRADFIIGNPPFIGASRMREALGDGYVETLWATYPKMPQSADFVMFWWEKAARLARAGMVRRFGFITTNSLRQTFNRRVLEPHLNDRKAPVCLLFAIPDHPWVDSKDGAAVRIAMTVAAAGRREGRLLTLETEARAETETDGRAVTFNERRGRIFANLQAGVDVASAVPLRANEGLAQMGVKLHGQGFLLQARTAAGLIKETPEYAAVVRPYLSGRDLAQSSRGLWVIDLFGLSEAEAQARFPAAMQHLRDTVKPERDQNNRATYRDNWWLFGEPRRELRPALRDLPRYIVTTRTARHRIFSFIDAAVVAESKLVAIADDDSGRLSVLSSSAHETWSLAAGGWLGAGNDPTYNHSDCFNPFPFPDCTPEQTTSLRDLGVRLDAHRKARQAEHPGLTLTQMYNVLQRLREIEASGSGEVLEGRELDIYHKGQIGLLKDIHDQIDAAVAEAYGWPADLSDEEILERLVRLNRERHMEEITGKVRWLRPDYQNPTGAAVEAGKTADLALEDVAIADIHPWPRTLPGQVSIVRAVLSDLGEADTKALAAKFKGAGEKTLTPILESLVARGMRGVEFIVSDDHSGLRAARRAVLGGATWQRCQFHLARNAIHHAPNAEIRKRIGRQLKSIWTADDLGKAETALAELVASYRDTAPKLAAWLEENVPEGLAVFTLPERHQKRLRTSNPIERSVQQQLKRRTVKVRVFPGEDALLRLVSAVLVEIDEKWASDTKAYIKWECQDA